MSRSMGLEPETLGVGEQVGRVLEGLGGCALLCWAKGSRPKCEGKEGSPPCGCLSELALAMAWGLERRPAGGGQTGLDSDTKA